VTFFLMAHLACAGSDGAATVPLTVGARTIAVEIAATEEERARGLMFRKSMPEDHGMLFIYPDEAPRSFWMKDTPLPLSIAFADRHGTIVRIKDMQPLDQTPVKSLNPATYALEMNQGWFERHGVKVGDKLSPLPPVKAN
jgi:hypothetical protein